MRALVMAAGLGTRLKPLTDNCPKPLVKVNGKAMIEYALERLIAAGINEAIVNIHYLPQQMLQYIEAWNNKTKNLKLIVQDESHMILDSGGGVAKASPWLFSGGNDLAVVINSDVICNIDIQQLANHHKKLADVYCTLTLMANKDAGVKYNGVKVRHTKVVGFERPGKHSSDLMHFPGIYVFDSRLQFPQENEVFSIVEKVWKPLSNQGLLGFYEYNGPYHDLGTVADLQNAERHIRGTI